MDHLLTIFPTATFTTVRTTILLFKPLRFLGAIEGRESILVHSSQLQLSSYLQRGALHLLTSNALFRYTSLLCTARRNVRNMAITVSERVTGSESIQKIYPHHLANIVEVSICIPFIPPPSGELFFLPAPLVCFTVVLCTLPRGIFSTTSTNCRERK